MKHDRSVLSSRQAVRLKRHAAFKLLLQMQALFPQQFRFRMEGLAAVAVVLFWAVVATTRRIINRMEGSQVSPV